MIVTQNAIRTARIEVIGMTRVQCLCDRLIAASQWFSVLPLPDDGWEIEVKEENLERLLGWSHLLEA